MRPNRFREALKEDANLIGLASALALSVVTFNPLPLLAGLVAEVAFLLFVPDSKWYEARLSKRFDDDVVKRRKKLRDDLFPTFREDLRGRFLRLESTRAQIDVEAMNEKTWFREVLRKLDYLLEKFLLFATKESQFRNYLQSLATDMQADHSSFSVPPLPSGQYRIRSQDIPQRRLNRPAAPPPPGLDSDEQEVQKYVKDVAAIYARELAGVMRTLEEEQNEETKAILAKRADVLQRRSEYAEKIGRILTNLNHQLRLVEDTFGLINDEIRARSPEQILADIEEVVVATDSMTQALEELAPYEQLQTRMSA